ncbi:MAG TPA: hypothetical protein VIJ51_00720 [Solirubrobacteraceae bacterium]
MTRPTGSVDMRLLAGTAVVSLVVIVGLALAVAAVSVDPKGDTPAAVKARALITAGVPVPPGDLAYDLRALV